MSLTGRIVTVYGNMVTAEVNGSVAQNAVAYCHRSDGVKLMSEIIRIRGNLIDMQVFELTRGLMVGDLVEVTDVSLRKDSLSLHNDKLSFRKYTPSSSLSTTASAAPVNSMQTAAGTLVVGSRIEHSRFGRGEVVALAGSGIDAKATVHFDNVGTKHLLLRFAKFTIL